MSNVRSQDRVARYGGDEFLIACPNTNLSQAMSMANRILNTITEKPFMLNDMEIPIGMSMGIVFLA